MMKRTLYFVSNRKSHPIVEAAGILSDTPLEPTAENPYVYSVEVPYEAFEVSYEAFKNARLIAERDAT